MQDPTSITGIADTNALDDHLSQPTPALVDSMRRIEGDIVFLGAAGKMGPTMCRLARRATDEAGVSRRIMAVSRFSEPGARADLETHGIETIACDLLDDAAVRALPDAQNIVYMAGMKFGTSGNAAMTWAMNTYLPARVAERYRHSRIAAFSTGNVYGMTPVTSGGSREGDPLHPVGEYAMSAMGRERMLEYMSATHDTPMTIIRLNYACELRYGVLVDLARWVWEDKEIDRAMGHFNVIWQRDANAFTLQSLEHAVSPPLVLNVTGPEILSVENVAMQFGTLMGKEPILVGTPGTECLLNNASRCFDKFGKPIVSADIMMRWIADWVARGGENLNRLTHFEVVNGQF